MPITMQTSLFRLPSGLVPAWTYDSTLLWNIECSIRVICESHEPGYGGEWKRGKCLYPNYAIDQGFVYLSSGPDIRILFPY